MRVRGVPLYQQVLDAVRDRLRRGAYASGLLPTEAVLVREFGVSRHTVRAALQQLVLEGLIERRAGRGTTVVKGGGRAGEWSIEAVEDLIEVGFAGRYAVRSARFVPALRLPGPAGALAAGATERLLHVQALRSSEEGPYAFSNAFFPEDVGRKLPRRLFSRRPLILLVEEYCSLPPFRTRQVASAAAAGSEAAQALRVPRAAPLLVLERTHFARDGRPLQHTRIECRPDRYAQVVHFNRRVDAPYVPSKDLEALRVAASGRRSRR
jgi:GntR family transcriptional regulator